MSKNQSIIATVLSLFIPGLGQIYSEHFRRGLILYFIALVLSLSFSLLHFIGGTNLIVGYIIIFIILLIYQLVVAVDSYITSRKTVQASSGGLKKWAKFTFICILLIAINLTVQETVKEQSRGLFKTYRIPAGSMEPALLIGDYVIIDLLFYKNSNPQRGDVIVFKYPEDPSKDFIKRVIAVEGEQIQIKDKKIFINGRQIEDPWGVYRDPNIISGSGSEMSRDNFGPVTVPANAFFVMGDNRDKSFDSRFWGYVDLDKVKGKALHIYWSWEGFFKGIRWNRIGKPIH